MRAVRCSSARGTNSCAVYTGSIYGHTILYIKHYTITILYRTSSPPSDERRRPWPIVVVVVQIYDGLHNNIIRRKTRRTPHISVVSRYHHIYNALPVYKQGLVHRARGVPQEDTVPGGCARAAAGTRWPAVSVCLYVCRTVRRRSATATATTCASFRFLSRRRLIPLCTIHPPPTLQTLLVVPSTLRCLQRYRSYIILILLLLYIYNITVFFGLRRVCVCSSFSSIPYTHDRRRPVILVMCAYSKMYGIYYIVI